jgi:predicted nucleotidyltransferase/transcriptional regulator with XRE-family HTH domain
MDNLGQKIRKLREEKGMPLRTVAAHLDIDQAILSKIERGLRNANREQVIKLADFFQIKENELLVSWLSDKLVYVIADEDCGIEALQVAEEKVSYSNISKMVLTKLIDRICNILRKDGRVESAWLFGSLANEKAKPDSDLDIVIELNEKKNYSMFDLMDISHIIENEIDRKVDLVEKGQIKDFALKTASNSLRKIYG